MTDHDQTAWQQRWARVLAEHGDRLANRPANVRLTETAEPLAPGRALDAGCGHGAETLWLAGHGWRVTAVDFSAAALDYGRASATALGSELAGRITWVQGDLGTWSPERDHYDLVSCLYVHVAGSVQELVRRLAGGVAVGGTLLLVGHRPVDPGTGLRTAAADQTQVRVPEAVAALGDERWEYVIAEDRRRDQAGTGVDAVVCVRRGS